jgi:hypothetical protein
VAGFRPALARRAGHVLPRSRLAVGHRRAGRGAAGSRALPCHADARRRRVPRGPAVRIINGCRWRPRVLRCDRTNVRSGCTYGGAPEATSQESPAWRWCTAMARRHL